MKSTKAASRLVEQLDHSILFQNYHRAFGEATGLPLSLISTDERRPAKREISYRNPFCELLADRTDACLACVRARPGSEREKESGHRTSTCFAGLCASHVTIRVGARTMGFLRTGHVATRKPTDARFAGIVRQLGEWGVDFEEARLHQAYFATRVVPEARYRSILDLLAIFAGHLSLVLGQPALGDDSPEVPEITRAKEYICEHLGEPLSLKQVAESAHLSSCYFCRKFKDSTGLSFTEYVARTRVEAAKDLLTNPQIRVSEVAYEVGFQTLTHFNRVFKELTGQSPTGFRGNLPKSAFHCKRGRHAGSVRDVILRKEGSSVGSGNRKKCVVPDKNREAIHPLVWHTDSNGKRHASIQGRHTGFPSLSLPGCGRPADNPGNQP